MGDGDAPPGSARIWLLNGFRVTVGGVEIDPRRWRLRRAAGLVKLLALAPGHRLPAEQLMAAFWPDLPPEAAANNLAQALHAARRGLAPPDAGPSDLLGREGDWLLLRPGERLWIDVDAFAAAAAEARRRREPAAYRAALDLYAGELLPEDRYDDWAAGPRRALQATFLALLLELAALAEAAGDPDAAVAALERVVAVEPTHEAAHRDLMRLHARAGRRPQALRQYHELAVALRRELDAEPEAASRDLHRAILAGEVGPAGAGATGPPPARGAAPDRGDRAAERRPPDDARRARDRTALLARVRSAWIDGPDGVLARALDGAAPLDLALEWRPDAVASAWDDVRLPPEPAPRPPPAATSIVAAFDAADGELLILGEPGAGKTTTLLLLARALIERAERDPAQPVPVVLNLSSWAAARRPLAAWLVDELNVRYGVPRALGRAWVDDERVAPLLDGLDEVPAARRAACAAALAAFHREHGLLPLAVCCRADAYDALPASLPLRGAAAIRPLTPQQVAARLGAGGARLAGLRAALGRDAALRELARTPLLLRLMTRAYADGDGPAAGDSGALERRRALLDAYVERALRREGRADRGGATRARTLSRLGWLARGMARRGQDAFLIERLQPDWLPSAAEARACLVAMRLLDLLGLALVFGLAGPLGLDAAGAALGWLAGVGVVRLGLAAADPPDGDPGEAIRPVATVGWSAAGAARGVRQVWRRARPSVVSAALATALIGALGAGLGAQAGRAAAAGLGEALAVAVPGLLGGVLVVVTSLALVGLIRGGLAPRPVAARAAPNAAIWASGRVALAGALLAGPPAGLIGLLVGAFVGGPALGLSTGLGAGVGAGLGLGLAYGGAAFAGHFLVRGLLWRRGLLPWRCARFLDAAAERALLRKVGAGYGFAHPLLLEHFVAADPAPPGPRAPGRTARPRPGAGMGGTP